MGNPALVPGAVVAAKFRLVRELGRGGMGEVWQAEHVELDIPCAVKFIVESGEADAASRGRFNREAKAAAQMRSPHVVQILDQGVWQEIPYIAMELLEGEDLRVRLARVGTLARTECLPIFAQVARALVRAHSLGIVHRDLKPDNVFLVRDHDRELVKILDFGIAKMSTTKIHEVSTKTGTLLGTPFYMSPEQARGNREVDGRADLWSFAVIIYESLVGKRPFESEGLGDLMMTIMTGPLPVPSEHAPTLPRSFDVWWQKAAAREPGDRFADATEMVEALADSLGMRASAIPALGHVSTPNVGIDDTATGNVESPFAASARTTTSPEAATLAAPSGASSAPDVVVPHGVTLGGVTAPTPKRPSLVAILAVVAAVVAAVFAIGGAAIFWPRGTASAPRPSGVTGEPESARLAASSTASIEPVVSPVASASDRDLTVSPTAQASASASAAASSLPPQGSAPAGKAAPKAANPVATVTPQVTATPTAAAPGKKHDMGF